MAKQTRELLFLKTSGVLIGEIGSDTDKSALDFTKFEVKTVEIDSEIGEYWYGDFSTGEVRSKSEKPVITESYLKYNTNVSILEQYSIHKQINIIIDMLDKSSISKTPEFTAMKEFLDAAKANHNEQIQAYSSNTAAYTWVSEAEEQAVIAAKREFE